MTRHVICQEGKDVIPGFFLVNDSLTWPEHRKIPVATSYSNDFIGRASDLRREEDGRITAEIELFDDCQDIFEEIDDDDAWCYTIYMNPAEFHFWKDVQWVTGGVIREISILPNTSWWSNAPVE